MTEKLKYKVGDKVLIEAEITETYKGVGDYQELVEGFEVKTSSKIIMPKPKVPQVAVEYYAQNVFADYDYDMWFERSGIPDEIASWLYYDDDDDILMQRQHALATLITYGPEAVEVEKKKKYRVKLKRTNQFLTKDNSHFLFSFPIPFAEEPEDGFTKQELIEAGFEGVFDNPMFEVKEVEK